MAIGFAALVAATGVDAGQITWGVNGHPITAYPGIAIDQQLDLVKHLGMTSYRVNIPDSGSAEILAELVDLGKSRGIEILPVLTPGDIDLENDTVEQLYDKSSTFAFSLASRFGDDIRVWELGNEMENYAIIQPCEMRDDGSEYPCDWGPAGGTDPLDYYGPRWEKVSAVLKGLTEGVSVADPSLRKAVGTAGWGHIGAFERMRQDGIDWDISVWHMYGQDPEWAFDKLIGYGKPIWVTEFNNPYGSQPGDQEQVDGLRLAMERLVKLSDSHAVEAAHIYELLDESYWAPDYEAFMGLVRLEATESGSWDLGEPKPAYHTVRDFISGAGRLRDCDLVDQAAETLSLRQASYAYCLVLGRDGEPDGLQYWASAFERGESATQDMLLAMLQSDEFVGKNGVLALTDRDYVGMLYLLLLDREADSHGLDSYVKEIASGSMTRSEVAYALLTSAEFAEKHTLLFGESDAEAPPG